jgi:signal transduction histidine kinase
MPEGDEGVEVEVSDRGIGIPPDKLDQVFDPYVTTKNGGSGIGLSMAYRIVQFHGGEITAESQMGEGSTFTVRLPEVPG